MTESFDMGSLFEQAQKMAEQMQASQTELSESEFEGAAGGGVVKVTLTGQYECVGVSIDPTAVDPADVGMLEDLVKAALLDASSRVSAAATTGMDLGGMDLGGMLGGLLGPGEATASGVIDTTAVEEGED